MGSAKPSRVETTKAEAEQRQDHLSEARAKPGLERNRQRNLRGWMLRRDASVRRPARRYTPRRLLRRGPGEW